MPQGHDQEEGSFEIFEKKRASFMCPVILHHTNHTYIYAHNLEEVDGAYWFQVVCPWKLTGHIGFGLSVRACMCSSVQNMHAISYEPCMVGF